ncbi:hypothetical protein PROFUN_01561 [Planoprotostelium fungivorum]|uniref:Homeobox domain-containing protein n=1 Tax=Planoprotostelium fungivorum TaxID=1890364 RepID=A0A2P6NTK1_9EUKA|nr:hypothetical protein PROFUN_01561 [Planoprotostelium fungivorum]
MDITRIIHQHEQSIAPLESFEGPSWIERNYKVDDIPACRRKRNSTPPLQRQMLENLYRVTRYPNAETRGQLAAIHHTTSRKDQLHIYMFHRQEETGRSHKVKRIVFPRVSEAGLTKRKRMSRGISLSIYISFKI